MSSSQEIRRSLRKLKPEKHVAKLKLRPRSSLPFIAQLARPYPAFLLDTTVYIDALQSKLPLQIELLLRSTDLWHSTVTEAELAALAGLLSPTHPDTALVVKQVTASIERRPSHRIVNPDREIWREAGILAGTLSRLQQYGKAEQRKVLNDALIFLSAAKSGISVLTRNISDFDFLSQLAPFGKAVFYDRN